MCRDHVGITRGSGRYDFVGQLSGEYMRIGLLNV